MILLDTSGLLAAIDEHQRLHKACRVVLAAAPAPLILSPFVLAELDYLLATRVGPEAEQALLDEVARGVFRLESFGAADVAAAQRVMARYPGLGLADASIVVLGERYRVREVLTLDERHFRAVRTRDRQRFRLLPADA